MWYSGQRFTPDEIQVLRELEYNLFMSDPGFRSMWADNFEEYFKALFDEKMWTEKEEERYEYISNNISQRMIEDREFSKKMRAEALADSVLEGEISLESVPVEVREEVRKIQEQSNNSLRDLQVSELLGVSSNFDSPWEKDPLFNQAYEWAHSLGNLAGKLYEQNKNIDIFRILNNSGLVASKLLNTLVETNNETDLGDIEVQIKKVYGDLSILSLNRCIESLERLAGDSSMIKELDVENFLLIAKKIRPQLIERLDNIQQNLFNVIK